MTELKHYFGAVGVLRLACRKPEMAEEDLRAQERLYAKALGAYDLADVREAVEDWASRVKWWPELADLLSLVREKQAIREAAARPKLPAPAAKVPVPLSDTDLLERWAANDKRYRELLETPTSLPDVQRSLAHVYQTLTERRWRDHPALAERYYFSARAAE